MAKICIIGTGYVGLVTGACFAKLGNDVICVDNDQNKLEILNKGKPHFFEEGLEEIITESLANNKISFTSNLKEAVKNTELIFICVGTPELPDGSADMSYVMEVASQIGQFANGEKVVVIKSTIPVTYAPKIEAEIKKNAKYSFELVSNPEFLAQGSAVYDFLNPDRVVVGASNIEAMEAIADLYKNFDCQVIKTDISSAIMVKYAANCYLATRISFINEIANLCEKVGADIKDVSLGMGLDRRIGPNFLKAGIGYGGSCFPKDTKALVKVAAELNYDFKILRSVTEVNIRQRKIVTKKLKKHLGDLHGKRIAILGLAFKPGTDDLRESPSVPIIKELINFGCELHAYDPIVNEINGINGNSKLKYALDPYEVFDKADALLVLTEYPEFDKLDFSVVKQKMNNNLIIDGKNILTKHNLVNAGFVYEGVGR